jgi:hypothetical protein
MGGGRDMFFRLHPYAACVQDSTLLREDPAHGVSHKAELQNNELDIHALTGELVNNKQYLLHN